MSLLRVNKSASRVLQPISLRLSLASGACRTIWGPPKENTHTRASAHLLKKGGKNIEKGEARTRAHIEARKRLVPPSDLLPLPPPGVHLKSVKREEGGGGGGE